MELELGGKMMLTTLGVIAVLVSTLAFLVMLASVWVMNRRAKRILAICNRIVEMLEGRARVREIPAWQATDGR